MAMRHPPNPSLLIGLALAVAMSASGTVPLPVRDISSPADNWFHEVRSAGGVMIGLRGKALFRSADQGSSWEACALPAGLLEYPSRLTLAYAAGKLWLAGMHQYALRSDDAGRTWILTGIGSWRRETFAVRRDTVYFSAETFLPPGSDTLKNMKGAFDGGSCLGAPFAGGNYLYSAGYQAAGAPAICRTTGPGEAWKRVGGGLPKEGNMAYAAKGDAVFATDRDSGVWVLPAGAAGFRRVRRDFGPLSEACFIRFGGTFAMATRDSLFYPTDDPDAWRSFYHPRFPFDKYSETNPAVFFLGNSLYNLFGKTLSVSSDSGRAWMPVPMRRPPRETAADKVVSFAEWRGLFFASFSGRLYLSADAGKTWQVNAGDAAIHAGEFPLAAARIFPIKSGVIAAWPGASAELLVFDPSRPSWDLILPGPVESISKVSVADGELTLAYRSARPVVSRDLGRGFGYLPLPEDFGEAPYVYESYSDGPIVYVNGGPDSRHTREWITFDGWKSRREALGVASPVSLAGCLHWGDGPWMRSACDRDGPIRERKPPMGAPQKWWKGPHGTLMVLIDSSLYRFDPEASDSAFTLVATREAMVGWTLVDQGLARQTGDRLEWAPFDTAAGTGIVPRRNRAAPQPRISGSARAWLDHAGRPRDAGGRMAR